MKIKPLVLGVLLVVFLALIAHGLVKANMLMLFGGTTGGSPVSGGGGGGGGASAPQLVTAPALSAAPTVTQATSNPFGWTGNAITVSEGTWSNCTSCTYSYQWYLYQAGGAAVLSESQNNTFQVPNSDVTSFYPLQSSYGTDSVWAIVTVVNGAGLSSTASTPVTPITRVPGWFVGEGNLVVCSDGAACAAPVAPTATNLVVGAWVAQSGAAFGPCFNTCAVAANSYALSGDDTGIPHQGWGTVVPAQATNIFQIPNAYSGYNIRATFRYTFAGGFNVGAVNSFPAGPVATSGGTILAPVNTSVPVIGENPAVPVVARTIPYVGFILTWNTTSLPGAWSNLPWNTTGQWMYCSTSANSGVPAACGSDPTAGSGASLVGTAVAGATAPQYPITTGDIGKQFFARITAYNTAGTTVQDSIPTAATMLPGIPAVATVPIIQGLAVTGNVGGGDGGAVITAPPGTFSGGPLSSFISTWFSCPTSNPTCTTPGIGTPGMLNGVFTYQLDPTDNGNLVRVSTTGFNAVTGISPVISSSAAVPITTYASPAPLTTALTTYPAGRDPMATFNCAPAPTTYTNNWYVDNSLGTNGSGTSGSPFNTLAHALAAASPGDRILLRGSPSWNAAANSPGNYGALTLSGQNVDSFGNTDWITIQADASTGAHPQISAIGQPYSPTPPIVRGWNIDGIWLNGTGGVSGDNFRDFIFQNGTLGYYPDLTTAISDYETNCNAPATCTYGSLALWLQGHAANGVSVRSNATCEAFDNNKMWFMIYATILGVHPIVNMADILFEGNDEAYITQDFNDVEDGIGPFIYHHNKLHNPIGGPPGTPEAHQDGFQAQTSFSTHASFGWEFDSNILVRFTPDAAPLLAYVDQPYCSAHSISPCTAFNEGGDLSSLIWSATYSTGLRWVNNVSIGTEVFSIQGNLATVANNTYVGNIPGFSFGGSGGFGLAAPSFFDYFANNAVNIAGCSVGSVFTNTTVLNGGSASGCSGLTSDTSGVDPFTDAYPSPTANFATTTYPITFNGVPPGTSSLFKTGVAGNNVPTVTTLGTASTSPPNRGAY